jgi:hypothetical protein
VFRNVQGMTKHLSRLGYCQYMLTSPTNCTLTNFADHVEGMSHDGNFQASCRLGA